MSQTVTPLSYTPAFLGGQPCEGGVVVRVPLVFNGTDDIIIDMGPLQDTGHFSACQTLFLDNHTNAVAVTVTMNQSLQTFQIPIGGFAYMPLLQPNKPLVTFSCSAAITLYAFFVNFFLPPVVWGPTVGGGGSGGVTGLTPTDKSGAIVAGGTPQIAIAANANRLGFLISNPKAATEILQVAFGNTGHYFDLVPGATYETGAIYWKGDIYVNAVTNAHAYTAYEGT